MELEIAQKSDLEEIYFVVQNTILAIYPKYYAKGVVDFFCTHHSKENILLDINAQSVFIIKEQNQIIASATIKQNHITRVFVLPQIQNKGIGSFILEKLEKIIFSNYNFIELDSSLSACKFYENKGYKTIRHETIDCENGSILSYEVMQKNRP